MSMINPWQHGSSGNPAGSIMVGLNGGGGSGGSAGVSYGGNSIVGSDPAKKRNNLSGAKKALSLPPLPQKKKSTNLGSAKKALSSGGSKPKMSMSEEEAADFLRKSNPKMDALMASIDLSEISRKINAAIADAAANGVNTKILETMRKEMQETEIRKRREIMEYYYAEPKVSLQNANVFKTQYGSSSQGKGKFSW